MAIFAAPAFDGHESVSYFQDPGTGLRALVAIHNTARGPALGGCRFWPYAHEDDALEDVLLLSQSMTYKAAMADLPLGGGKMVVLGDPATLKNPETLRVIGRFVDSFKGAYITAEDMGVILEDIPYILESTPHVVGRPDGHGDPSLLTAYGVYQAMKSAVAYKLGRESLHGIHVLIQGLGAVGYKVARHLHEEGARLTVFDIQDETSEQAKAEFGATVVSSLEELLACKADVFAPCARGGILNRDTRPLLKVSVICGAANNQMKDLETAKDLEARGILYTPDYVANQGGLVCVYHESIGVALTETRAHLEKMNVTLREIFSHAENAGITTTEASDQIAEKRFQRT